MQETHHVARYTWLCNFTSVLLTLFFLTLRLSEPLLKSQAKIALQEFLCHSVTPVSLYGYSANFSPCCICLSLGTPRAHFLIWV